MKQKIYQVDAFTDKLFTGNPAAVCPLSDWIDDETMLNIAMENNLAETAFYVKKNDRYEIRWFTPAVEVDLCGHATLASAFIIFNMEDYQQESIEFYSPKSGRLTVTRKEDLLVLDFPSDVIAETDISDELLDCFAQRPVAAFKGKTDIMLEFETENQVCDIKPDFNNIAKIDARGIIVTARGDSADFVSRFFAPAVGVNEDPVTGSAHTTLIPYWAKKLGKETLTAVQLSKRTGRLECKYLGDRVEIGGIIHGLFDLCPYQPGILIE